MFILNIHFQDLFFSYVSCVPLYRKGELQIKKIKKMKHGALPFLFFLNKFMNLLYILNFTVPFTTIKNNLKEKNQFKNITTIKYLRIHKNRHFNIKLIFNRHIQQLRWVEFDKAIRANRELASNKLVVILVMNEKSL